MDRFKNLMWWAAFIALCAVPVVVQFALPAASEWFTCGTITQNNVSMLRALAVVLAACTIVWVVCGTIALLASGTNNDDAKS